MSNVPRNVINIIGQVFGRLTVVAYEGRLVVGKHGYHYWTCRCRCDPTRDFSVKGASLRSGNTTSCGCRQAELTNTIGSRNLKHGRTKTKEFRAWSSMLRRCHCLTSRRYPDWGGRGIYVCDRWREAFLHFLEDMGKAPSSDHTIERIDNDGPYCKENCRWAHYAEQARNTRKNRILTFQGRSMILSDWAREIGLDASVLQTRLRRGWTIEEALSVPHSGFGGSRVTRGRNGHKTE